ncbi:PREDICTED: alpha- and gamma-adaptin-binding protein p34-like [Nicrophorus vespilloides]|uniref:Alpha- and gamma-adaptin-binding protein p34-like n=1 Tax=Nicrophorus vespilloides TaxID=110193 RepID=A0ABM1N0D8_NICVS|nr:PREDICTED: alpha- and gamma-adaptin-binding protein p34-like [Nicrophorus vespilloides]
MDSKPCVVIVSSSNTKPKSLIKLITKENPVEHSEKYSSLSHPWRFETKYYTAEVELIGLSEYTENEFQKNVEALIIHMDSNKSTGLDDLKEWEPLETNFDPDIKLLIANYCNNETKVTKAMATDWCLKRGFEFIEIFPAVEADQEEQDLIEEKIGVDRIIEALETHIWSNLVMKDKVKEEKENKNVDLDELLMDDTNDDFTDLFNKLHMMKDSIQSMPVKERKQCAEQVVSAFWKAIGGDEEEIADL